MRICPRCTFPLHEIPSPENPKVKVDFCRRCKGTFIEPDNLVAIYGKDIDVQNWLDREGCERLGLSELYCPIDDSQMYLYRIHLTAPRPDDGEEDKYVEVDICRSCGGIWFDPQEAQQLLSIVKANKGFAKVRSQELLEQLERENNITSMRTYYFQLLTGLPIEDYNPVRKRPVVLFTILSLLVFFYILEVWLWASNPANLNKMFFNWGLVPTEFFNGRYIGLITHIFLHDAPNPLHLLGNLYFLYVFGDNIEDLLGYKKFLIIFFVSGIVGALFWMFRYAGKPIPLIGASGAISGLMGAYAVLFPRVKVWIVIFFVQLRLNVWFYLLIWVGYQVFMWLTRTNSNVAFESHIAGFIAGIVLALMIKSFSSDRRIFSHSNVR